MSALVVMGVAGCGKSSVASAVASALHLPLLEGDDFHSEANRAKMRGGCPLSDLDRTSWLALLGDELRRHPTGAVLSCSALKQCYRDQLRAASPGLRFAWLDIDEGSALARVAQRGASHYFPASIVASQFEALEPPNAEPGVLRLDALRPLDELADQVVAWVSSGVANQGRAAT
jgi:gluconokinase